MAFFEGWPYTNFHDMNLDWVIETCRKIHVELHQLHHELHRAINCEEQARIDADIALGQRIDQEIQDRTDADNALGARIDKEIQDRTDADNALGGRIDQEITDRTAADQAELEARTEADNALSARIDKEIQDRTAADQQLQENINQEISDRQEAVSAEAAARQAADQQLQTNIDKEISDRTQAVTAEAEARAAADTALGQRIDQEISDRTEADSALSDRIDQEITDRTAADAANTQAIAAEAAARADADTHIQDDLSHEITDRQDADTALGQRIDDLQPQLIPAGGTQGQVLAKTTGDNYAVAWTDPGAAINGLPEGGTDGQILQKSGSDNFVAKWVDTPTASNGIPAGGSTGQVLAKVDDSDYNAHWIDAAAGPEGPQGPQGETGPQGPQGNPGVGVPTGGSAGQVLAKVDGTDYNTHWVDQTGGGSGDDPNAIKKDGTTETTATIPFAEGISNPYGYLTIKTTSGGGVEVRNIDDDSLYLYYNVTTNKLSANSPRTPDSGYEYTQKDYVDDQVAGAISDSKSYTDTKVEAAQTEATSYTDSQIEAAMADVHSIPAGGSAGQVLAKVDGTDYNTQWVDQTGGSSFEPKVWFDTIADTDWTQYIDLDDDMTLINASTIEFIFKAVSPDYCEMTFNTNASIELTGGNDYPNVYPNVSAIVDHFATYIQEQFPGKTVNKGITTIMKNRGYVATSSSTSFKHYQQDKIDRYSIAEVDGLNNANLTWGWQRPKDITSNLVEVGGEITVFIPMS